MTVQGKGGTIGSFVMVQFKLGASKRFKPDGTEKEHIAGTKSAKSPMAMVKQPIAKYFGFDEVTSAAMLKLATRVVKVKINGKEQELKTTVKMGATGKSRSVTVRFTKPQKIGEKTVNSIKIPMPSSHTFGNMVQEIMESKGAASVASVVSPTGASRVFHTPYNPKHPAKT
jgi:hypothetical protein